jgi:hypothetical protein
MISTRLNQVTSLKFYEDVEFQGQCQVFEAMFKSMQSKHHQLLGFIYYTVHPLRPAEYWKGDYFFRLPIK